MKQEQSLPATWVLLLGAWLFISLLAGVEVVITHIFRPETIKVNKIYILPVIRLLSGIIGIFIILLPGYKMLKGKAWGLQVSGYFGLLVAFVFTYLFFTVLFFQMIFLEPTFSLVMAGIGESMMTGLHHVASYFSFLLLICAGKDYFDERTQALVRKEQVENELSQAKLLALQKQIQPHFLFNTLNNAIAIMEERKGAAQEMLVDLSELLRTSMSLDFSQKIPLKKELEILALYIAIEQKRFEHQLRIQLQIRAQAEPVLVPPFLLQPIVENAIKHGFKGGKRQLQIILDATSVEDHLILQIKNDGAPLGRQVAGIGLQNVKDRLQSAFPGTATFQLEQKENWVINTIKLPIHEV